MPKRVPDSDDSEYQEDTKESSSPKKPRTPKTPSTRRISNNAGVAETEDRVVSDTFTKHKRKRSDASFEESSTSPSKVVQEAEAILAQYSPGTKRNVKLSDLKKLQATHEMRKEEALLKVEKQKKLVEERRQEIFSRLAELGYSKTLIERDGFDQLKARTRWWQLVEEPQVLTDQGRYFSLRLSCVLRYSSEWEKMRLDLCVILDRRKETVRSMRTRTGGVSASSSPLRPKPSPVRPRHVDTPNRQDVLGEGNGDGAIVSGKRGLQNEMDDRPGSSEDSSETIPKLVLGNAIPTRRAQEEINENVATQEDVASSPDIGEVLSLIELPCGRVVPNRLVKAAMYEHLASFFGGPPNRTLNALYSVWARGGWGMIITGNVQVSCTHLSLGADMVVPEHLSEESMNRFRRLSDVLHGLNVERGSTIGHGKEMQPLAIMQLNHTGRQSPNVLGGRFLQPPLSASATRVGDSQESRRRDNLLTRAANAALFQRARAMSEQDVKKTVDDFVRGARLAHESGFDGIQIHAAHGYLIAQFISRKTNLRTDKYDPPLTFLCEIVEAIRLAVPRTFVVGLKLNAADYATGGFSRAEGAEHIAQIARWQWNKGGVDFIEISGGDYESPEFMQNSSSRQAFFESFSHLAVTAVENEYHTTDFSRRPPLIMLSGGLRTRGQFSRVLGRRHAHLLGLARLSVLQPNLPQLLYNYHDQMRIGKSLDERDQYLSDEELWSWEIQPSPEPSSPGWWPHLVGAGIGMAWYVVAMRHIALARELPYRKSWFQIVLEMYFGELWDKWRRWFLLVTTLVFIPTCIAWFILC
ncbi:hypothetical protein ACEPAI_9804 [Sanghuangporus weigelae]